MKKIYLDNEPEIKKEISDLYLSGMVTLKSIKKKYNLTDYTTDRLVNAVVYDSKKIAIKFSK